MVFGVGTCKAGHPQVYDPGATLTSISEMPGRANRKARSGNANGIKRLA